MKTLRAFPSNFPSLFDQAAAMPSSREERRVENAPGDSGAFTVGPEDSVLVSAVKGGRLVATVGFTGMSDLSELMRAAAAALKSVGGLVTLRLRNRTQGTSARRVVMLGRMETRLPFRAGGEAVCTAS
ncbi:MAG: hypothetical protein NC210_01205 [[Clostridium] fimetarium]|nr:hypothetical protein [Alistipes timonensis]MCM1405022.1 hypothetical protein [[Clostridium] fimetarium]